MSENNAYELACDSQKYFEKIDRDQDNSLSLLELEQYNPGASKQEEHAQHFLLDNYRDLSGLEGDGNGISRNDLNTLELLSDPNKNGVHELAKTGLGRSALTGGLIGGTTGIAGALMMIEAGIPGPGWVALGLTAVGTIALSEWRYLSNRNYYAQKQELVGRLKT